MATRKSQRIGIIIILVALVIGTLGSFAVMVLGTQNQQKDAAEQQKAMAEYQKSYQDYQAKLTKQSDELSAQYYPTFGQYASRVGEFSKDGITSVQKEDLVVGEGEEIKGTTKFAAYYIGWNPKGKVFDQSIEGEKLKEPIYRSKPEQGFVGLDQGLDAAGLIAGWKEGMKGMKVGGVREITIPSDKAYGEQGQGDNIPPNTPLKFIVMAVTPPEKIAMPDYPAGLMQGLGGL